MSAPSCGHVEHSYDVLDGMRRYGNLYPGSETWEPCPDHPADPAPESGEGR